MNPIVVAFGEHGHATASLRWAAEASALTGCPLRIVSICESTSAEITPARYDELVNERRTDIAVVLDEIARPDTEVIVDKGDDPVKTIIEYLDQHEAAFVIFGARDPDLPVSLGAGGRARHLLHHTKTPVAVIRTTYQPLAGGTIVVGVDGSSANDVALRTAAQLAEATKANIHAVFAQSPTIDAPSVPGGRHRSADDVRAGVARITSVDVRLFVERGHPVEVLMDHARRECASVIVVGARGRGGFNGLRLGSVPGHLLTHATCPLVVVPC